MAGFNSDGACKALFRSLSRTEINVPPRAAILADAGTFKNEKTDEPPVWANAEIEISENKNRK